MNIITDWQDQELKLGIATDHGGLEKKKIIIKYLADKGINCQDFGPTKLDNNDDYTDYANVACRALVEGKINCAILLCRSGIGMSITANRFHGIRAALVEDVTKAKHSRSHNATNVLVTGGDSIDDATLLKIVDAWLSSKYSKDERHNRRLNKIETLCYDPVAACRAVDSEIATLIDKEAERQDEGIELIASENFASPAVLAAVGSVLGNKYAEGYPRKRYYNGCEFVDEVEQLAIDRACELFGAEAANVQPHSGSQANMATYFALIEPGDTVLAMSLAHGGHLSHGLGINFSGRFYNFVGYGVDKDNEVINYDEIARLAQEHKPKLIMAGASAYPRSIDFKRLREIADSVGAYLVVDMAHIAGLVAAGQHESPVPYADVVTTTTHKTLRGPRGGMILAKKELIKKINSQIFPGIQGGPLMHVIAGKAICFKEAMSDEYKTYQKQVVKNAKRLAAELVKLGFRIVSGGTDNHLMLVDLRPKEVTGKAAATALDKAGITVNKNLIPFDPAKPFVTSGIRVGTPAVTTRGMKETEMVKIAQWINKVIDNIDDAEIIAEVRAEIACFTREFPMPLLQV